MSCRCSCSPTTPRSHAAPTSISRGISPSPSRSNSAVLKTTPFHERTAALCASHAWRRWAGHIVASSYELSHEREYHVIRTAAALFDVSPLYKYLVRGRDAARLLDLIVTRNVLKAEIGQVLYTPWAWTSRSPTCRTRSPRFRCRARWPGRSCNRSARRG